MSGYDRCRFIASVALLLSVVGLPAAAQQGGAEFWPQVHSNRRVTFYLRAPAAQHATLEASFLSEPAPMTKDAEGLWSVTVGPLAAEIYEYNFKVDALAIADPMNPFVKVWRRSARSMVLVPGDPPMFYEEQDVPHGTVHVHRYRSKSLDVTRGLYVYTPPGYETSAPLTYPVLYLLHGSGDTEDAWTVVGRANRIADNALAAGRARPMIVVMPYGHTPNITSDRTRPRNWKSFESDLIGDVIPFVEKNYRTQNGSEHRAIVGLSMGGGQSLRSGLGHSEMFGWIGAFSSSAPSGEELDTLLARPEKLNEKLRLLWIGCGRKDFLFEANQKLLAALDAKAIRHTAHITDGGHEWPLWRHYLNEVLPRLFDTDR
jgi:enterochelin esterase family protein